jgi:CheY-like chemotaxis protein
MARILVADNDSDALDLAMLDLRLEGHTVAGAPDGASALALVEQFLPDVVVLDYRMPPSVRWRWRRSCDVSGLRCAW